MRKKATKFGDNVKSAKSNDPSSVRLVLFAPGARDVCIAGTFNDWLPAAMPMKESGRGCWIKDLSLAPGRYEYLFVVDGHWMPDRTAKKQVDNPFGGLNSVLEVLAAKEASSQGTTLAAKESSRTINLVEASPKKVLLLHQ